MIAIENLKKQRRGTEVVLTKLSNGAPIKILVGDTNDQSELTLTNAMTDSMRAKLSRDLQTQSSKLRDAIQALQELEQ